MNQESLQELVAQIAPPRRNWRARAEQELLKEVRVAPTLVKYADPNQYEVETRRVLRQVASELMGDLPIAAAPTVDLLEEEPLEDRAGVYADLRAQPLLVPADSPGGASCRRANSPRDHRPGAAKSRTA